MVVVYDGGVWVRDACRFYCYVENNELLSNYFIVLMIDNRSGQLTCDTTGYDTSRYNTLRHGFT